MRLDFDFIAQNSFQTTADGQRLFYPNGMIGKAYVIESDECYQTLFRQQKRWGLSIFAVMMLLFASKVGGWILLASFLALNLLKQLFTRRTTQHMPVATTRYSVMQFFENSLPVHRLSRGKQLALLSCTGLGCLCLAALAATDGYLDIRRQLIVWSCICGLIAWRTLRALRAT
ncbi:MAG: hypothetical protein KUL75_03865 [Sterolibacterium sp.]|nr:hypothetical protein [Sterolibacterium sp.]